MRAVFVLVAVASCSVGVVPAAWAATVTEPTARPVVPALDAAGHIQPMKVAANGYTRFEPVYVEQCDGTDPGAAEWTPAEHCDLASSPSAAYADAGGAVVFDPASVSHAFAPFVGESPQGFFNCNAPGSTPPKNDLPNFTNCQIRVATNNSSVTADQIFLPLRLPANAKNASKRPVPRPAKKPAATNAKSSTTIAWSPRRPAARGSKSDPQGSDTGAAKPRAGIEAAAVAPTSHTSSSSSNPGLLGLSDTGVALGYALVALGVALVAASFVHRRSRRVRRTAARSS